MDQAALMEESMILDNSQILENFEAGNRAPKKKIVVPMGY